MLIIAIIAVVAYVSRTFSLLIFLICTIVKN